MAGKKKATNSNGAATKTEKPSRQAVKGKTEVRKLPVPINPERRDEISQELVDTLRKIDDKNAEKSNANGRFNADLKDLNETKDALAQAYRDNAEMLDIETVEYLEANGEVKIVRTDTGAVVDTRPATATERQPNLPLGGDEADAEDKPKARKNAHPDDDVT